MAKTTIYQKLPSLYYKALPGCASRWLVLLRFGVRDRALVMEFDLCTVKPRKSPHCCDFLPDDPHRVHFVILRLSPFLLQ